jgi:hypothetical protein
MTAGFKYVSTSLLAALVLSSAVLAGPLEDGNAAYKRHDYKTAMRILRPLAIDGDKLARVIVGLMYEFGYGVQFIVATHVSRPEKSSDGPITNYIVIDGQTGNYLNLDNIVMAVMGNAYDNVAEPSATTGHCDLQG